VIDLHGGAAALRVDPDVGGRVGRFAVDGLDLLVEGTGPEIDWGCFLMAPWAGRIRRGRFAFAGAQHDLPTDVSPPHAIHGTVLDRPCSVVWATEASAVVECSLGRRWPWPGRVRQTVSLGEDRVEFRLEVHADDEPFPAAAGWHPWFRRRLARGGRADTRYVVVYDQPEHTVCVEPQTGPPDALNLGPVVVTPDRPLTAAMTWSWAELTGTPA
jgi:aldose 1-epimerase